MHSFASKSSRWKSNKESFGKPIDGTPVRRDQEDENLENPGDRCGCIDLLYAL